MATYTPTTSPPWPERPKWGGLVVDFNQSTIATHEIRAATTGKRIRLISADLFVAGAQVLTFKSGTDDIAGGVFEVPASGYLTIGPKNGHFIETASGSAFQVALSAAIKVRGPIVLREVV